jgi:hypothetical protein
MGISFRNGDNDSITEIFFDNNFIGTVVRDMWKNKWKLKPAFKYNSYVGHEALSTKYDSSYTAGKALVRLYEDIFSYNETLEDTQEIDMREFWKSFK